VRARAACTQRPISFRADDLLMGSSTSRRPDQNGTRADQRDAAVARVSRITNGTALAGGLATVGFAGLAALTFSGNPTTTDADQATTDQTAPQSTTTTHGVQPTPATGASATAKPNGNTTTVNPPTVTTHVRSHVSTGGSR
jgi:hypothetical protein